MVDRDIEHHVDIRCYKFYIAMIIVSHYLKEKRNAYPMLKI